MFGTYTQYSTHTALTITLVQSAADVTSVDHRDVDITRMTDLWRSSLRCLILLKENVFIRVYVLPVSWGIFTVHRNNTFIYRYVRRLAYLDKPLSTVCNELDAVEVILL